MRVSSIHSLDCDRDSIMLKANPVGHDPFADTPLEAAQNRNADSNIALAYAIYPRDVNMAQSEELPRWRIRFELVTDPSRFMGVDIYNDVILGRDDRLDNCIDLSYFKALPLGVSRRHAALHPTPTQLLVTDLGSTNGTRRNGHPIGANTPYSLGDGDILALGALNLLVRIIERPRSEITLLYKKADLADALVMTARAITSQLEIDQVLKQVAEATMTLTAADITAAWLINENTGELTLEALHGSEDETLLGTHQALKDSYVGRVIVTGKPVRLNHEDQRGFIEVMPDFPVASLILIPVMLGGISFGVLGAFKREEGHHFNDRDEKLVTSIADFAAIAVQNARLYQATDRALARRIEELGALNELSFAISSSLDLNIVHNVLKDQIRKHWKTENVMLWLLNEETGRMELFEGGDPDNEPLSSHVRNQVMEAIERVIRSREPERSDWIHQREVLKGRIKDKTAKLTARSIACIPLLVTDQVVGVLVIIEGEPGAFAKEDLVRFQAFANPVATAIHNARLFSQSERERAIINATASTLSQPIMILDARGDLVIANDAANQILDSNLSKMFDGISQGIGKTTELQFEDHTFLTTVERQSEVGTIVVMQDITYLKQLEETRLEFVHALSHDLKSPLTSIQGYADLVRRVDTLSDKGSSFIDGVLNAAHSMSNMIEQLLDIALLTESPQSQHKPCDLVAVINRAMNDLEGAALAKLIPVDFITDEETLFINGDETRLYRSILNLLDNALKYSPEQSPVQIFLGEHRDSIWLQVRDNGPGIPEEDIPHIFEKYYRGQQEASRSTGHGLGLVLVQSTANAHGGAASVANAEGSHGAIFTISLPADLRLDGKISVF